MICILRLFFLLNLFHILIRIMNSNLKLYEYRFNFLIQDEIETKWTKIRRKLSF